MGKRPSRILKGERLSRYRGDMPPIPPGIEKLARAREAIDPDRVYRLELPDGTIHSSTGRQMIEMAEGLADLARNQIAGNEDGMQRAVLRVMDSDAAP